MRSLIATLALMLSFTAPVVAAESQPAAPAAGPFLPTFESLASYQCPDWFRDAKFGIWAHWGPQCVPMSGDWYARKMYEQGAKHGIYEQHLATYGHPSKAGFKDIIPQWKAEKFDPERLMGLYKKAGARYFVSMGVHHDNFDLWNSRQHKWNAVQMGPQRDIVGAWQAAARKEGLRFGVSEHLAASYTWYQAAHGSDKTGPLAGVPYDGADPQWQDLYHPLLKPDDKAWYTTDADCAKEWLARITDLIDSYHPDLLYSDGALPFGEVGRTMLAHYYNADLAKNGGRLEAVYNLKDWRTRPGHGDYVEGIGVQDVERGGLAAIKPAPWQTDTSIGDWFYNKNWKTKDTGTMYRTPQWVIHTLIDVVSKNGNMLLNVIQRPDGTLDPEVEQLLATLATWMSVNSEAIHGTRPWLVYGESPARAAAVGHFKEDFGFTAADIRFTRSQDGRLLYALTLGWPEEGKVLIRSLATVADGNRIAEVELLGQGKVAFTQTVDGLAVTLPAQPAGAFTCVIKITGENLHPPQVAKTP